MNDHWGNHLKGKINTKERKVPFGLTNFHLSTYRPRSKVRPVFAYGSYRVYTLYFVIMSAGHRKTRLMVSQCGINGVFEAIYHDVPLICIPIQSDQWDNARRLEVKGVGLQLELRSLTKEKLIQAVNTVLRDDR